MRLFFPYGWLQLKKKHRSFLYRLFRFILMLHLWLWALIAFFCVCYIFINPPVTPLILHRYLVRGHSYHKRYFIELEKVPKSVKRGVLTLEDPNFYKHYGFEWEMIKKAQERNRKAGKIKFGASTISNQLARTMFLTTHRTYLRKYLEAQITVIMEIILTKDRMLELYLNYVEWGKGIYGVDTASRVYFGKSSKYLTRNEAYKTVSILTNPIRYTPHTYYKSASARQRYAMLQRYQ